MLFKRKPINDLLQSYPDEFHQELIDIYNITGMFYEDFDIKLQIILVH